VIRRQFAAAILTIAGAFVAARAVAQQPNPDPRVGLRAGWWNAGQAAWNMRLVSTSPPPKEFIPDSAGDFEVATGLASYQGQVTIHHPDARLLRAQQPGPAAERYVPYALAVLFAQSVAIGVAVSALAAGSIGLLALAYNRFVIRPAR